MAQIASPTIQLTAPTTSQLPTVPLDVEVRVTGAINLAGFEFDLGYNAALVQVTGMTLAPFIGTTTSCDATTTRCAIALGPRTSAQGTSVGAYSYGTGVGTTGDGVLAILHLQPAGVSGTTVLHLSNALIA
ncbi:MAG TPA: hypothetical protein VGD58_11665, partial [Herpetosiphonaceae bacterium]